MANFSERSKHAPGRFHGDDFVDAFGIAGVRIGIITRVDELHMKADVRVITGGADRFELNLTQAMARPRSFWGGVAEDNSVVVLGYLPKHRKIKDAVILGYLPSANLGGLRFDPFATDDPTSVSADEA